MSERMINIAGFYCRAAMVQCIRVNGRRIYVNIAGSRGLEIEAASYEDARDYAQQIAEMVNADA